MKLFIESNDKNFKYAQIRDKLIENIENGNFKEHLRMPSIAELCETNKLSKVSVERAYMGLKSKGYIKYIPGKGFFILKREQGKINVLLVFNNLSYNKKLIYDGIVSQLKPHAKIDIRMHHYEVNLLNEIINENLGNYNYFIITPHFEIGTEKSEYLKILKKISPNKLLLLDKDVPEITKTAGTVYQDFENDIFLALEALIDLADKYLSIKLIIPPFSNHPSEIVEGARRFCLKNKKKFSVLESITNERLKARTAYITVEELELGELIKKLRVSKLVLGQDIGIISFNETVLKELLEITTFSTDFTLMGRTLGEMIINKKPDKIKNPMKIIRRKSF
ncbi:MAG: GntR family transcriptional regulator [Bacteroidota bacterium]